MFFVGLQRWSQSTASVRVRQRSKSHTHICFSDKRLASLESRAFWFRAILRGRFAVRAQLSETIAVGARMVASLASAQTFADVRDKFGLPSGTGHCRLRVSRQFHDKGLYPLDCRAGRPRSGTLLR